MIGSTFYVTLFQLLFTMHKKNFRRFKKQKKAFIVRYNRFSGNITVHARRPFHQNYTLNKMAEHHAPSGAKTYHFDSSFILTKVSDVSELPVHEESEYQRVQTDQGRDAYNAREVCDLRRQISDLQQHLVEMEARHEREVERLHRQLRDNNSRHEREVGRLHRQLRDNNSRHELEVARLRRQLRDRDLHIAHLTEQLQHYQIGSFLILFFLFTFPSSSGTSDSSGRQTE